uniref:GOLD domain-containing protein n=2 Tax=Macrostomum lignano TaxID=282301 RepID=A0A1I8HFZ6_9PLAT
MQRALPTVNFECSRFDSYPIPFRAVMTFLTQLLLLALGCLATVPKPMRGSTIELKPDPRRPSSPTVWLRTRRPETSYEGPLHQFESAIRMHSSVFKLRIGEGAKECFYYVLLAGYQLHFYATTVSSNQPSDVFDIFISNGDGEHVKDYVYQTSVSHRFNVTENDAYEVCIYNPVRSKIISYSSYHYLPSSFEKALKELAIKNNVTMEVENSVVNLELNLGQALAEMRTNPLSARDFLLMQATHGYVMWKAVLYISLMSVSFGGTTLFIRGLFSGQRSSV